VSCSAIPELDLGEWGSQVRSTFPAGRYPLAVSFELTDRCNLGCVHCYINQAANDRSFKASELDLPRITGILDQLAAAGVLFVLFTGGEVLLRPDFLNIYREARQRGFLVSIFTNATLVTPRIAAALGEIRPYSIEVTLYGATAGTYEHITQSPGSYQRCRTGIDLLLAQGLPVSLKTILLQANRGELPQMQALAAELGVAFRYDGVLWPRLDGSQQPFEFQVSPQDILTLEKDDQQRQGEFMRLAGMAGGDLIRSEYVYTCGAGLHSCHIDSQGRVSICVMARQTAYDLLQDDFADAWERLGELRKQTRKLSTACRTCKVGALCTQCPGWSQAVHGDDETPVDIVCSLGRLRARQLQQASPSV
jgi:radical SAM protein with 4Fe4S-binding SPASM domain